MQIHKANLAKELQTPTLQRAAVFQFNDRITYNQEKIIIILQNIQ
jgi:hypothetical protein